MSVFQLPVPPPVAPMLAALVRDLPADERWYEPKWDGFRCVAFRDGADVLLASRNHRPLNRYFPEVEEALLSLPSERCVVDGEIVVSGVAGLDFAALMLRLHPAATRVAKLRIETPACLVAFDLLALGHSDLRARALTHRRELLAGVVTPSAALAITPAVTDPAAAREWMDRLTGSGIDGVVAKDPRSAYEAGRRTRAWLKAKRERTLDCVVAGFRRVGGVEPLVASLLLGLHDANGELRHVGVASSFPLRQRSELFTELQPYVMPSLAGHPWVHGFALERGPMGRLRGAAGAWDPNTMTLDWVPLKPDRVCEVAYDQVEPSGRLRHPARFRRWRPDRDPASCTIEQFRLAPVAP